MKAALKAVWDEVGSLHMPVLIAQGGADRIVDPDVARPFLDLVPSSVKELMWVPDHYHELHNEPNWLDTMMAVAEWIEERLLQAEASGIELSTPFGLRESLAIKH